MTTFQQAVREHTSILAAGEKRTLIWIAERLPMWLNSDHLTGLGFVSLILAGGFYWLARWSPWMLLGVIVCLALNWFGDSLDGTLARVRNRQRPRYGFYVDHILDAFGMIILTLGIVYSGLITPFVVLIFLVGYLLLSIEIYLATYTLGKFHLSYWSFGPTELRILLAIGNLAVLRNPIAIIAGHRFLLFDLGFGIGAAAVVVIAIQAAVKHTRQLYREEALD